METEHTTKIRGLTKHMKSNIAKAMYGWFYKVEGGVEYTVFMNQGWREAQIDDIIELKNGNVNFNIG